MSVKFEVWTRRGMYISNKERVHRKETERSTITRIQSTFPYKLYYLTQKCSVLQGIYL